MASIKLKQQGHYEKTKKFLNKALHGDYLKLLDDFGHKGVELLRNATPKDSGVTAASWSYSIDRHPTYTRIFWSNDNKATNSRGYDFNIVILLLYGHATRNGGWVEGYNFVDETMKPIFDEMAKDIWNELIKD